MARTARLFVLAVAGGLLVPSTAAAHLRSGTMAADYRARVTSPPSPAFAARVYQSDRALHVVVRPGHTLVVLGYLGEPFLRIDAAGVTVAPASPTAASTHAVSHAGARSATWHDARVQSLPPGTNRARWSVAIVVDGRRSAITGVVWRVPRPSWWLWLAAAIAVAAAAVGAGLRAGPERLQTWSVALGAVAATCAVVAAAGFSLSEYASPGTWIESADEAIFALAGAAVLAWGPRAARAAAGGGLGLLALAVGLSKGAVFLHAVVLSALPGSMCRALVLVAVAAGSAAAAAGVLHYVRQPEPVFRLSAR